MKRIISIALIASATLAGAAVAQERTADVQPRSGQAVATSYDRSGDARPAPRRCSGTACLQSIPSLGVAF